MTPREARQRAVAREFGRRYDDLVAAIDADADEDEINRLFGKARIAGYTVRRIEEDDRKWTSCVGVFWKRQIEDGDRG